ncbi:NADPH oxidase isoform 2 [Rhodotorula toruloides]|uniref:NADPH oxidase isoform 2 n=1 Tax=Rhodotorula toruloides TaxID=5286 RepID=A0A511KH05_RHOTO|nr:NADPH oxidase isoform 2 [Rhodotorula toruloides]
MVSFPSFVQDGRFSLAHHRSPASAAHLDSLPAHTAAGDHPTGSSSNTTYSEADKLGSEAAPHVSVPLTPRSDLDSAVWRSTSRAIRRPEEVKRHNEAEQDRLQGLMRSATVKWVESRDEKAGEEGDRWLRVKVWLRQDGPSALVLFVWLLLQLGFFAVGVVRYDLNPRAIFGSTYVIARSAAFVLHIDVVFILLPICRGLVTLLRRTALNKVIPFDESVEFHKVVAWSIVFWTAVHLFNSWWLGSKLATTATAALLLALDTNFTTGPFLTGWIMLLLLGIMAFFAVEKRRRPHFQRFYWSHHLFIPFFVLWQFHGMFCMIKPDRPPYCSWTQIGVFWMYWILGGLVYIGERILREIRSRHRTYLSKVVVHPSNVVELRIKKEKTPRWHPFTLTSAPEEDFLSIHIRVVGDWTRQLAVVLGCEEDKDLLSEEWTREKLLSQSVIRPLPRVMVDGPFGTATEDVLKYEVTVLVGAGIGVTPFAAILKHIWYRLNDPDRDRLDQKLRKVYFFWICRDAESFEWFRDLLHSLEERDLEGRIEIHTYLTATIKAHDMLNIFANDVGSDRDAITQLRAPTHYGRPNWDRIFASIAAEHPASEVGVFCCGPKPLSTTLYKMCIKHTTGAADTTRFTFSKERF